MFIRDSGKIFCKHEYHYLFDPNILFNVICIKCGRIISEGEYEHMYFESIYVKFIEHSLRKRYFKLAKNNKDIADCKSSHDLTIMKTAKEYYKYWCCHCKQYIKIRRYNKGVNKMTDEPMKLVKEIIDERDHLKALVDRLNKNNDKLFNRVLTQDGKMSNYLNEIEKLKDENEKLKLEQKITVLHNEKYKATNIEDCVFYVVKNDKIGKYLKEYNTFTDTQYDRLETEVNAVFTEKIKNALWLKDIDKATRYADELGCFVEEHILSC